MKIKVLAIVMSLFTIVSCEFRKSVNKDLVIGLTTKGDGLSCDNVYLSMNEEKIRRNTFTYGEKFYLNFETIEGFKKDADRVFPGMQLFVIDQAGDTVLIYNDLYADYTDGITISPLLLQTYLTVAKPIHSNNTYVLYVTIWDKRGEGTFTAKMDFDVIANKQIEIESSNVSYDEIYLFSQEREVPITDNNVKYDETVNMIFEGLEGFREENGIVFIGLAMNIKDSEGNLILNEDDLIGESGMEFSELKSQIAPSFIFTDSDIKNPVTCEVTIWDKKSESRIKAIATLHVE